MIGHTGQVCPILIPSGHSGETSQDDSLHKAYISCPAFRGKDSNGIRHIFRDSLREIYDKTFDIDAEPLPIPEDYFTAISHEIEAVGEGHTLVMEQCDLLYLFEYYKITKVGGAKSSYACAEWQGIQIPHAILSLLDRKGLQFTFFNDKRVGEDYTLLFHERNPAGRGLDFEDFPEVKSNFVRYAVELRCLNPVLDTEKTPLPPLEDLVEAVTALLQTGL